MATTRSKATRQNSFARRLSQGEQTPRENEVVVISPVTEGQSARTGRVQHSPARANPNTSTNTSTVASLPSTVVTEQQSASRQTGILPALRMPVLNVPSLRPNNTGNLAISNNPLVTNNTGNMSNATITSSSAVTDNLVITHASTSTSNATITSTSLAMSNNNNNNRNDGLPSTSASQSSVNNISTLDVPQIRNNLQAPLNNNNLQNMLSSLESQNSLVDNSQVNGRILNTGNRSNPENVLLNNNNSLRNNLNPGLNLNLSENDVRNNMSHLTTLRQNNSQSTFGFNLDNLESFGSINNNANNINSNPDPSLGLNNLSRPINNFNNNMSNPSSYLDSRNISENPGNFNQHRNTNMRADVSHSSVDTVDNNAFPGVNPVLASVEERMDRLMNLIAAQNAVSQTHTQALNNLELIFNRLSVNQEPIIQNARDPCQAVSTANPVILGLGGGENGSSRILHNEARQTASASHNLPTGNFPGQRFSRQGQFIDPVSLNRNNNGFNNLSNQPIASRNPIPIMDNRATSERRWKDIMYELKVWQLRFPQNELSADQFLLSVEAKASRQRWSDDEVLRLMGHLLVGQASYWYDVNYPRMQQMYRLMSRPPSEFEQVTTIRNHLQGELRNLVFARSVATYDGLHAAIREATQAMEESRRVFGDSSAVSAMASTPTFCPEKRNMAAYASRLCRVPREKGLTACITPSRCSGPSACGRARKS
ncbi:putative uncharacterized protein DDB_G0286901 [Microplitis mediator]|uniref:putative uncharacterized protein DDB_G0286901 n=1 Tax=Microplitis mediator TaxID=375433 RepID=UPI002555AFC0|nr:putative uncharacterized protein DDB_G0286901 [Microplitis mediator]